MKIEFIPVETKQQVNQLATMANIIWHEWFPGIISEEQINYMVEKFQSEQAIEQQIRQGYIYALLCLNGIAIGYVGLHPEKEKLFLSKIYLLKSYRGKGYATQAFEFVEGLCLAYELKAIYLTVNRNNQHAFEVYKKKGFKVIKEEATEIGQGFVMDDYIMEKTILE